METKIGLRIIETLTSALYSDPIILFREYVQNSMDSYLNNSKNLAKSEFRIDITVNIGHKKITIRDNGYGVEREFIDEMKNISKSKKAENKNLVGFKGIGRLSGMPFCENLIFTNKCQNSDKIEKFTWRNNAYRELLDKSGEDDLTQCIDNITEYSNGEYSDKDDEHFFEVCLIGCTDELLSRIKGDGDKISTSFVNELSTLLPVPYSKKFKSAKKIKDMYCEFFGENKKLDDYEFSIFLDDEQIFKPFTNDDIKSDIYFHQYEFPPGMTNDESKKIGVLWFSFDYVFKSYQHNDFGISVRSKNILVNDKSIFADECSKSIQSPANYGALIAGLKGVKGEWLIFNDELRDNSKRDWFVYDCYGLYLRSIIVNFMENMHKYRYAASRFKNKNDNSKSEEDKLSELFEKFISSTNPQFLLNIAKYSTKNCKNQKNIKTADGTDDDTNFNAMIADDLNATEYSLNFKNAYAKIMKIAYQYFKKLKTKDTFFALRAEVIKELKKQNG